ncbi:oxidoreductase [Streptomyces lavendulae subsp. lavendulae]|uniref:FAD-binding oxidoreductase n=1 Tax=Streptomyces lavendulae TaxID=1914 RepID=UPI0024A54E1E|nr:FAD-binding oxidoreductase [Streptomyces lavendulae]GLV85442.1 oxidoreductase [Streptomyces lavendulae subsp. lavendulae]
MSAQVRPSDGIVGPLRSALGAVVHAPGTTGYENALARVFFPDAARRRPACVVAPRTAADVATVLKAAAEAGVRVTVRGGGLSSNCVADGAVVLDLSEHGNSARPDGDRVVVGGGATMATMLGVLGPAGRTVPVGVSGHTGLGMATRGGIGYLTRSLGLTVDHLVGAELVLPSGDVVRLSERSAGEEADLWWAVRGAAPYVGVVTSAVFRTHESAPVWVDRAVVGLDALATYFRVAPELPRDTSMSAVLGYTPLSPDEPVLFVYTVCAGGDDSAVGRARAAASAVVAGAGAPPLFRSEGSGRYLAGLPEFAVPGPGGAEPGPIPMPGPGDGPRGSFSGKAVFTGPTLDAAVADALAERIRAAPTKACRIDFQHTGGALADVDDTATAFWGRTAEWSVPLNAIWDDPADTEACGSWVRGTLGALAAHTVGVYNVELRPGLPETEAETRAAYGGNLARLRALRHRYDGAGLLSPLLA